MRLKALKEEVAPQPQQQGTTGESAAHKVVSWEHRIVRPRDDLDLKVSGNAPEGARDHGAPSRGARDTRGA